MAPAQADICQQRKCRGLTLRTDTDSKWTTDICAGRDTVQASVSLSKPMSLKKSNPPAVPGESHRPPRQGCPPSEPATRSQRREQGAPTCRPASATAVHFPGPKLEPGKSLSAPQHPPHLQNPLGPKQLGPCSQEPPVAHTQQALRERSRRPALQKVLLRPSRLPADTPTARPCITGPLARTVFISHALLPAQFSSCGLMASADSCQRDKAAGSAVLYSGRKRPSQSRKLIRSSALTTRLTLKQKLITVTYGFFPTIFKVHLHTALNKTFISKNLSGSTILNCTYKTLWPESKKTIIVTLFYLYLLRNLAKRKKQPLAIKY